MITLLPSKAVIERTGLDFELLSFIFSRFVKTKRALKIKVHKSKGEYSAFYVGCNLIKLHLPNSVTQKYIVSDLLHELRHILQVENLPFNLSFKYGSFSEYHSSPEEKDARKFEKLATEVNGIYKSYKKLEAKIVEMKLDSFKELTYNYGEHKLKQTKN